MRIFRRRNTNPNNPTIMQSAIIALLRHLLTFIGGTLVAKGILDSAALTEIIGAIISIVSVSWMAVSKYNAPAAPKP
jgi:positive regulator of sigma E activity